MTDTEPIALEVQVYAPDQVVAAMILGPASGIEPKSCVLIARWLAQALPRKKAKRCLCLTCKARFNGKNPASHDWSVVVVTPMAEGMALTSGLCPACFNNKSDLPRRVVSALRAVIPDATIVQEGHA